MLSQDSTIRRIASVIPFLVLLTGSCVGFVDVVGAPCDDVHPCPGAYACVDGGCVSTGRIACDDDEECTVGVCNQEAGFCVTCMTKAQCSVGVCHPDAHICVGCMEDVDCQGGVCLPQSRTCVGCRTHTDCPTRLCNIPAHVCLGCKSDAQCPSRKCDEQSGICDDFSTEPPPH